MTPGRSWIQMACGAALVCASAHAQTTTRVSLDSGWVQGNDRSGGEGVTISVDGRYVAFASAATNLVPGDTNGVWDVFVRDRQTGTTERVSVDSGGVQGNSSSYYPSISADGRYVAFTSDASNLVPGDTNGFTDIFVRDRQNGTTERVSVDSGGAQVNGGSAYPTISADGRYVAFASTADNLVTGDANGAWDVFIHDRQTGTTELVSVDSGGTQGNSGSFYPSISGDVRFVAFMSNANNLVAGDTNATTDVFVHDRQNGTTELISVDSSGAQGNRDSDSPSISVDGRYVAFISGATNLVPGDTNGAYDVFVRDRQNGATERVSVNSGGLQGNSDSIDPSISADGHYVAFWSLASNLVPADTNGNSDVFLHDRQNGTTGRVSVDSGGAQGNGNSGYWSDSLVAISADGRCVVFVSDATNLVSGDTNGAMDVFVHDRECSGSLSTYCTAKTNSLGCLPSIGSLGLPSQSGPDNFYVSASNVRNNKLGMMLWSLTPDSHPFFGGTLCLHAPIKRTPGQNSGGSASGNDCTGIYSFHFTQAYMLQQLLGANTTVFAQYWSRDPGFAPPNNIGLTNGLSFTICP